MVSWSDLASDVLEHLTSFLTLMDQQRFGAVCHNWRSVAKQKRHPPVPQFPWSVLGEDETTKKRNFFNFSEKRLYSVDIPELYGHYVCGSSFGWLFTIDEGFNGRLINPLTRECYELPPYPPYDDGIVLTEEPVFDSEGNERGYTFKQMQTLLVDKAVLSHDPSKRSDFSAMIVYGNYDTLALWRPGEKDWTVINPRLPPDEDLIPVRDVIRFKGRFYVLSGNILIYSVERSKLKLRYVGPYEAHDWSYLVELKGKLLLILRCTPECGKPTSKFLVYEADPKTGGCCERNDIHDLALFVGNNSTMVVDPMTVHGCMKNCIYFGDMCESYYWLGYRHDAGVYNMVSKTVRRHPPGNAALNPPDAALMWFTPNP